MVWVATPVRAPVAPKDASPIYPFVPAAAPELTGPVAVGPARVAAIWLDPLDVVRVTRRAGARPRFYRIIGDGRARARADEPGAPIDERSAYLSQPPGRGDLWLIGADADATVLVERPLVRAARTAWNQSEDDVLAWIDRGSGPPPPIPVAAGSAEVALLLRGQADLAARTSAGQASLAAWRKASALLALWAVRPLLLQHFFLSEPDVPGATGSAALDVAIDEDIEPDRPYRRVAAGETRAVVFVTGPGVLRVDVRGLADLKVPRPVSLTVREGGRVLGAGTSDGTPAVRPDEVLPPAAIPAKLPLRTRDGEPVTGLARAAVAVPPGEHSLEVTLSGGPLLVRPVWATRRPRLGHAPSVAGLLAAARAGGPEVAALADGKLPEIPDGASAALYGWLVLERARRAASPRAVLASLRRPLPAEALPALADVLPEPTLLERLRVQEAGALALAFRARFYDPGVTERYRAAWRGGAWSVIAPGTTDDPERPTPWTWLDATPDEPTFPSLPPPPREQATLFRLPLAAKVTVTVPPSPHDPGRPGVIAAYIATTADAPGPFTLTVDGVAFAGIGLAPIERLEVAAPPGAHEIIVEAPEGSEAWVALPPAQPLEPAALRRYFPTTARAHWSIPDPRVPGAIRVELRAPDGTEGPIAVTLRGDTGEGRTLAFDPGGEDPRAIPVDAPGPVSGSVTLVYEPPTGTREVWVEADRPLYASVAVRRAGDPTTPPTQAARAPRNDADNLARISALTRSLADRADDRASLVERAHLLLDLQQGDLARQDLLRLSRLPAHRLGAAETELGDRLDAYSDPAHVPLPGAAEGPVALAPGLLALGPTPEALAALVPAARAARNGGPAVGLKLLSTGGATGAAAAWARARLTLDAGRPADAGLHLAKLSSRPPVALEALGQLLRALEAPRSPPPGTAATAFGLASRLRQVTDHPTVRRALIVAGALSRWNALEGVEASAGLERLLVGEDPTPLLAVRQALLPTPWPADSAHTLPPGVSAGLDVTLVGSARLTAQAFCVEVRVTDETPVCRLTFRVDGREIGKARLVPGSPFSLPAEAVPAGRHRLEAALSQSSTGVLASVRFLSDRAFPGTGKAEPAGHPISIEKPERLWAAEVQRPVVVTVLGPGTLRVTARALVAGGATTLRVEADARDDAVRDAVPLDPALDDGARGEGDRRVRVNRAAEGFVLLTEAVPYKVTLRPDRGTALVRLALREDAQGAPPRIPPPWWDGASPSALLPWPGLAPGFTPLDVATYCAPGPRGLGSLSLELYVGTQPIGEQDTVGLFHGLLQVGPTWRYQPVRNLWLKVAPVVRVHDDTPVAFGITAALYGQKLPADFRLDLELAGYTQRYAGAQEFSLSASARLDRPIPLGGAFSLIPGVGVRGAHLSLDRATVVTVGQDTDSEVYNDFTRTHPFTITPRLALAAWPFQDLLANLSFSGTTYRDQKSFDHVSGSFDAYALFPVLGETFLHAGYGVSYRFTTADRLAAFLRHQVSAALEWSVWTGDEGRFVLGLSDSSYVIEGEWSHVVALGLRYDWTGGRGLTDMFSTDEYFDELTERRVYLPAPPGRPLP